MFQGLPLHAASNSTWFIQSYTLTLGSLLGTHPRRKPDLNWAMGVVGVTETGPNEGKLKHVETEVRNIERIVKHKQVLLHKEATAEAVKRLLETYSWIHLACHGEQNKEDPRSSCLKLYQDTLNLDTILHLRLSHAEFVFLAACETVKGDDTVINESLHLGGGFIAAGFRGAIGTLWTMSDADGPALANAVYSHLFRNTEQPKVTEVAEALQVAVVGLRKQGISHRRWVPFIHIGV
jgi:CHAT domain-containing protein